MARHNGLPTRVLDWSLNALVALYFAVEERFHGDSVVYAYHAEESSLYLREQAEIDPLEIDQVYVYFPPHQISRWITSQTAALTVHPEPWKPFASDNLTQIRVPSNSREDIRKTLFAYGFHKKSIYPGLLGLCAWIKRLKFGDD